MSVQKSACAVCSGVAAIAGAASAQQQGDGDDVRPVVVEMFLSQSCKSSPPAAKHLHEIAKRDDVVALAWHVDYWNSVPAFDSGAWADPFARREFSQRHKAYNVRLRRSHLVSTPQAIVDGAFYAVGSKREAVEARITEAQFMEEHAGGAPPRLELSAADDDRIKVRIEGVGAPYDAFAVSFRPKAVTKISGGDNAGETFDEINVVTGVKTLAASAEGARSIVFSAPEGGEDCAIVVQERGLGRIVAATYCSSRFSN